MGARLAQAGGVYDGAMAVVAVAIFPCLATMLPGYLIFLQQARARLRAERMLLEMTEDLPSVVFQYRFDPAGGSRYEFLSAGIERVLGVERTKAVLNPDFHSEVVVEEHRAGLLAARSQGARDVLPSPSTIQVRRPPASTNGFSTTLTSTPRW